MQEAAEIIRKPFILEVVYRSVETMECRISAQSVKRSEREMDAKSCINGAPRSEAAATKAGTPGMTSTSTEP